MGEQEKKAFKKHRCHVHLTTDWSPRERRQWGPEHRRDKAKSQEITQVSHRRWNPHQDTQSKNCWKHKDTQTSRVASKKVTVFTGVATRLAAEHPTETITSLKCHKETMTSLDAISASHQGDSSRWSQHFQTDWNRQAVPSRPKLNKKKTFFRQQEIHPRGKSDIMEKSNSCGKHASKCNELLHKAEMPCGVWNWYKWTHRGLGRWVLGLSGKAVRGQLMVGADDPHGTL